MTWHIWQISEEEIDFIRQGSLADLVDFSEDLGGALLLTWTAPSPVPWTP